MFIKILLLIVFFSIMLGIGFYCRKHANSVGGFVLGGRNVGPWLTAFAYGTSYFSAVVFVGYAGQFGWKYGIASSWIGIGNAFIGSLLAWIILGRRTRVMSNHLSASTMPDFFGKRYDSQKLKIAAAFISFIFLIPYTASVYNGLSLLFEMAFHIPYTYCVIGMAALTGIYVIMGGYMATAINDFVQGIIMLFGIVAVVVAVLSGQGGFTEAVFKLAEIPSQSAGTLGQQGAYTSFFGPDAFGLLSVVILTSLGTWGLPQMVQKFYSIKNEKSIKSGTIISTVFALVVAGGSYFLGGFGRLFDSPSLYNESGQIVYDRIIPTMLSGLPDILVGIVIVLVLSASMSTLSSLVLTSSSTITLDFIKDHVIKNLNEKRLLLLLRFFTVFFIAVSVIFALNPPAFIAQLMGISWGALAGSFLAPFLYGLYWKRTTRTAVWASFVCGVGITVGNLFFPFFSSPIEAGAGAMIAGLVIVPVVSLLSKKPDAEKIAQIFDCYNEPVTVRKKSSLPLEGK